MFKKRMNKNDRMIPVHFQGKPFNITVIQVYNRKSTTMFLLSSTSNAVHCPPKLHGPPQMFKCTQEKNCDVRNLPPERHGGTPEF